MTTATLKQSSVVSRAMLAVDVAQQDDRWPETVDNIEAVINQALQSTWQRLSYPDRQYEVSVALIDDAAQRTLNRDYRGQDKSTNVLSFPNDDPAELTPPGIPHSLGDVSLAFETVRRECEENGIPFRDHFIHLLVHGMLHLAGYDHETDVDAVTMETLETSILAELGISDPYRVDDEAK